MAAASTRERCERLLAEIGLPRPFTMESFCHRLGAQRGKPLQLVPTGDTGAVGPSGAWIELADRDVILYDATTSPFHQQLIVGHELGHMLCDHYPGSVLEAEVTALLLPNLDPALVRRILNRTDYSSREEREAETFATLLLQRAGEQPADAQPAQRPEDAALLTQLGSTFEE
jgi:hypothetical protein